VANASYDAMFKIDHDSLRVHQVLAEAYAQSYQNDDAIKEFALAVQMAPRQPGLHEELGDQEWIVGHLDKAADAYREELRIDPNAVTAMYKLGSLLVQNQNAAEGVEFLRSALHHDSTLSDAHYYLGIGLLGSGHEEDAIGEFKQAITADPASDRAMTSWYKLAQVYRQQHNTTEAQAALENFQRMRAAVKERQDSKTAQLVRKRTELPVEDKDAAALTAEP
jgi:Tfp pilus assembly protein PilF